MRRAALGALARRGPRSRLVRAWTAATADADAGVRRNGAELAPRVSARVPDAQLAPAVAGLLGDADVTVVEAAAWALGELGDRRAVVVDALAGVASGHRDTLAREAAVAALGALGAAAGLAAVLGACRDVATVRRRAVLALAPFGGAEVEAALRRALDDRDWQVRQAAEDLLDPPGGRG